MTEIFELKTKKLIKVLRKLMAKDRVEITYTPDGNFFMLPITKCVYFVAWQVIEKEILICEAKLDGRLPKQNSLYPVYPVLTISIAHIAEIKKLISSS